MRTEGQKSTAALIRAIEGPYRIRRGQLGSLGLLSAIFSITSTSSSIHPPSRWLQTNNIHMNRSINLLPKLYSRITTASNPSIFLATGATYRLCITNNLTASDGRRGTGRFGRDWHPIYFGLRGQVLYLNWRACFVVCLDFCLFACFATS